MEGFIQACFFILAILIHLTTQRNPLIDAMKGKDTRVDDSKNQGNNFRHVKSVGRQLDDQFVSAFENCDYNWILGEVSWELWGSWDFWRKQRDFFWCIGKNLKRLIKHYQRQFPDSPPLLDYCTNSLTCKLKYYDFCNLVDEQKSKGYCVRCSDIAELPAKNEDEYQKHCPKECNDQFVDSWGDNCTKYAAEGWCTLDGGYGSSWDSSWGTFEDWTNADGESATVCKQCGCGGEGDDEWISGNKCKGRALATVFADNLGKSLDTAKNECATACNMREDCHFASLTWKTKWQHCDLHGKLQEGYCEEFDDHWMWHLYIKKQDNVSL